MINKKKIRRKEGKKEEEGGSQTRRTPQPGMHFLVKNQNFKNFDF